MMTSAQKRDLIIASILVVLITFLLRAGIDFKKSSDEYYSTKNYELQESKNLNSKN